jgi:hypothetical protein
MCRIRLSKLNLHTPAAKKEIHHYNSQYRDCLSAHPDDLVVSLMAQPDNRWWPRHLANDLSDSKCNYPICSLVFNVYFVSPFPTSYNRLYLSVTRERYRALFCMPFCKFYTVCWMYLQRLQIKWDYRKINNGSVKKHASTITIALEQRSSIFCAVLAGQVNCRRVC